MKSVRARTARRHRDEALRDLELIFEPVRGKVSALCLEIPF